MKLIIAQILKYEATYHMNRCVNTIVGFEDLPKLVINDFVSDNIKVNSNKSSVCYFITMLEAL